MCICKWLIGIKLRRFRGYLKLKLIYIGQRKAIILAKGNQLIKDLIKMKFYVKSDLGY